MIEAKRLLNNLPDDWRDRALLNFDEEFFEKNRGKEYPLDTAGDVLRCAFAWELTIEGYDQWCGVHESYGDSGYIEN